VKNIETIVKRLRKLRIRHLRKYLSASQSRIPENCVYNHKINVKQTNSHLYSNDSFLGINDDRLVVPTKKTSVVILNNDDNDDFPCVCLYGCKDPSIWEGELCYTIDKSSTCNWFKPTKSINVAENEFDELMKDDEYVNKHYKDIASLQWVIEDRIYKYDLNLFERILRWVLRRKTKVPKALQVHELNEIDLIFINDTITDPDIINNEDFDPKLKNLFRMKS